MTITAPYNFVPLSAWIFQPDWKDQASMDIPFKDGYSGTLDIEITAHTPILVGGNQERGNENEPGKVHFFKTPDGHAIPGSSLKGMVRNVLEIATFGKMSAVDDRWLSIRDLTGKMADTYRRRFSTSPKNVYVKSGFLRYEKGTDQNGKPKLNWEIIPCNFARVDQDDLVDLGGRLKIKGAEVIKGLSKEGRIIEDKTSIPKYLAWQHHLDIQFDLPEKGQTPQKWGKITPFCEIAHSLGKGQKKGRLVFTGQPSPNTYSRGEKKRRSKYLEFIFHNPKTDPNSVLDVDQVVMKSFLHIHETSEEWKYWRQRMNLSYGIPVFFLKEDERVTSIGLAMMYRLPYSKSIGQTIETTYHEHRRDNLWDLPELMFGKVSDEKTGLKGRVNFGMAPLKCKQGQPEKSITTILSNPKPSFFPAYVEQNFRLGDNEGKIDKYSSYMDSESEIRGWKRYPTREKAGDFDKNNQIGTVSKKVQVTLNPLAEGSKFQGKLRIHNLKRFELGALLWALTWGGNPKLRHSLGMGKPFGMGQISIRVLPESWERIRANTGTNNIPEPQLLIEEFRQQMNVYYENATNDYRKRSQKWEESVQLQTLLAMARPAESGKNSSKLCYMDLKAHRDAKSDGYGLLPYIDYKGIKDQFLFHRESPQKREEIDKMVEINKAQRKRIRDEKNREEEERQKRELYLSSLSPTARRLKESSNEDECAAKIIVELENSPENPDIEAAMALKKFYQDKEDWDRKKPTEKLAKKIKLLKKILGEED